MLATPKQMSFLAISNDFSNEKYFLTKISALD